MSDHGGGAAPRMGAGGNGNGNGHTLAWKVIGALVPITISIAGFLIAVGSSNSEQREHNRRLERLENWRDNTQENQQQRELTTSQRLTAIETKLDYLARGLGVPLPSASPPSSPPR